MFICGKNGFQSHLGIWVGIFLTDKPQGQWAITFMVLQPCACYEPRSGSKEKTLPGWLASVVEH